MYLTNAVEMKLLCCYFGITQSQLSKYLWNGLNTLNDSIPNIGNPNLNTLKSYADAISAVHPKLKPYNVIGFIDGLKLQIKRPSNNKIQKLYYNGWKKRTEIGNVM